LWKQIQALVAQLNALGISRNDRVAVVIPNGAEMAVAFCAIASCATCAPLNPNYREAEFDFFLGDLNPKALIYQSGVAEAAVKVAQERGIITLELSPILNEAAGIFQLQGSQPQTGIQTGFSQSDDIALVLHTSGTTSRPKIVPLTHHNLCTSAHNIRHTLKLQSNDRALNVMPLFHIHGLIGVLLSSISAGAEIICTPGFYAPQFFDWIKEFDPTWYSAVPTMHQSILTRVKDNSSIITNASIRLIRSSSAPLPPQVMRELEIVFNVPVIESYGMTEASHQMASNPLPPQIRKPGSVGIAAGPKIAIMDEVGNLLKSGEIGEVVIQGNNVTLGYQNHPEANEKAFKNGWFSTGDLGYLDSDGYLFLKGRIKEIINRGGEKISPREVDEVLLDHPAIDQVVTFAAPHTLLGEDVAAAVVLKPNQIVTEQEIQEFAAEKLADFKVPRVVLFLDEIPKGPTGKRQRIGLAEKLGLTALNNTASQPSKSLVTSIDSAPGQQQSALELEAQSQIQPTALETVLAGIWANYLRLEQVGIHDNFFELGGQSLDAVEIIGEIQEIFQVSLSPRALSMTPTVTELAQSLATTPAEKSRLEEIAQLTLEILQTEA
jgi:acyl-CoA synthetase (AMP-forming)/AMP-acid ligase II/acyl carrier protein